jgi:Sec-independent protein translocase protein TatA
MFNISFFQILIVLILLFILFGDFSKLKLNILKLKEEILKLKNNK